MKKCKELLQKYKHAIPLLIYGIIYLNWFSYLEKTVTKHYQVIHMDLDDYIPFCEIFIVPYLLWFVYVASVIIYLLFKDKNSYMKCCCFLFTGMTIFLIVSTLWPNGHHLRPYVMPRDNIFTRMIAVLYQTDTATNIWPSIHVYNSLGAHLAVAKCQKLKKNRVVQIVSLFLCISIILSTMLIKQHSVFDVITAFLLAWIMYILVYNREYHPIARLQERKRNSRPQVSS
ncbi:MAG: phosphatase PAP2 family protein [Lachnospiraceae bacterium]|nr:phosphatase PAP2 family protein [Lachnospiraceae bacterium]